MAPRMSGVARRIKEVLDARLVDDDRTRETGDIILTVPNPAGRGWLHLTGSDLRDLLAENARLQQQNGELFTENHELQWGPTVSAEEWEVDGEG